MKIFAAPFSLPSMFSCFLILNVTFSPLQRYEQIRTPPFHSALDTRNDFISKGDYSNLKLILKGNTQNDKNLYQKRFMYKII